jgi:hypothetical protein
MLGVDRHFNATEAIDPVESRAELQISPMRQPIQFYLSALILLAASAQARTLFVAPSGSGTGASTSSPLDFPTAAKGAKAGDTLSLVSGTYAIPYAAGAKNTITLSAKGTEASPIVVRCPSGRAVIDFGFPEGAWVQDSYGFLLSGSWWFFQGIEVTRAGYQGVYVTGAHNTFDNCSFHDNRNSGIEINKGGSYTLLRNCDSYRNYDPKKTGTMSDGFAVKQQMGPGNRLVGCRAWDNSDDGYDTFASPMAVIFDSCWAFRNGWYKGKAVGNGQGFKVGGDDSLQNNILRNCASFHNLARGFDQNNNVGGVTVLNCVSWKNGGQNFIFNGALKSGQKNVFRNNVSFDGGAADAIANATQATNSWSGGFSVSAADFQSLDTTLATVARNADGSLPATKLLRLVAGSDLVDAGSDAGLRFLGSKPDLGAFEYAASTGIVPRIRSSSTSARRTQEGLEVIFVLDRPATVRVSLRSMDGRKLSDASSYSGRGEGRMVLSAPSRTAAIVVLEIDGALVADAIVVPPNLSAAFGG